MPDYVYRDSSGHEQWERHCMLDNPEIRCRRCDSIMRRVPQAPYVNWNGLRPSQGELAPVLKEVVKNAERNRDLHWERKEKEKEYELHRT